MTKLSDTQLVILGAAAQRADLSVLPLPDSLKLKGGALAKVMDALRNRGLIRVVGADGGPERVVITSEGVPAIAIEPGGAEALAGGTESDTAPRRLRSAPRRSGPRPRPPSPTARPNRPSVRPTRKPKATKAAPAGREPETVPDGQPTAKPPSIDPQSERGQCRCDGSQAGSHPQTA